jgi:hypothetical protein
MKRCPACGKGEPDVAFYTNLRPTSRCKGCVRVYNRTRRAPETVEPSSPEAACELDALTRGWTLPGATLEADAGPSKVEIAAIRLLKAAA